MGYTQTVANEGTSLSPSWTIHDGKEIWIAWKGEGSDPAIYVAQTSGLTPDPNPTTGQYTFSKQAKLPDFTTGDSPAITSLNGTLYLFWRGQSDSNLYWASSPDGITWTDLHQVGMGPATSPPLTWTYPQTSHGPVVVSGNNSLYLFWAGFGTDTRIYSSTYSAGYWSGPDWVSPQTGGVPATDESPAVVLSGQSIYLAWRGANTGEIWYSKCSPDGTWAQQYEISAIPSAYAPSLALDGGGTLWVSWVTAPNPNASEPWIVVLPASLSIIQDSRLLFASLGSGGWSAPAQRVGATPGSRAALLSTGKDSTDIMMLWKAGSGDNWGINYGPLRLPPISYVFEVQNFECRTTRSGDIVSSIVAPADTDYLSLTVQVTGANPVTATYFAGNIQNGQTSAGGITLPPINIPDNAQVVMTYLITNSSLPESQVLQYLSTASEKLAAAGATAAATALGDAIGTAIGAALGTAAVPLIGSALGALAGFLVADAWHFAFPNCDGPVAAAVRVFTAADLATAPGSLLVVDQQPSPQMQPPMVTQDGCGSNPLYFVDWGVKPAA